MSMENPQIIRILCPKSIKSSNSSSIQWLISSPFFPKFTIISTIQCLHFQPSDRFTPHFSQESDDLRSLIIRGFHVVGAVVPAQNDVVLESSAKHAIKVARELRKVLYGEEDNSAKFDLVGGVSSNGDEVRFFVSKFGDLNNVEGVEEVVYEEKENAEKFVWERGCLINCRTGARLCVYVNPNNEQDAIKKYLRAHEGLVNKFKGRQAAYIVESLKTSPDDLTRSVVIPGSGLDFETDISDVKMLTDNTTEVGERPLCCSYFCSGSKNHFPGVGAENAGTIQVIPLLNKSVKSQQSAAPVAEYCPAKEAVKLVRVQYNLDVICYAAKDLPLTYTISKLIIPALVDQLTTTKSIVSPSLLSQHPQLNPYHFCPPGLLHPVTALYELSYGETELKQVEIRRSLHLRLGLPCDRPLLRVANALCFFNSNSKTGSTRKGYPLLKDVHVSTPSSGVSGGLVSLVQGSYEYHHYLQGGFDDSGWGCAYRSLQTIISWFRLQHYTTVDVPTHREIQEALVEIGDKDPSFIGSREWIGAIELSYVLDKLLGVTCKVMNLRSGAEFPEKCRELALHFENQGTPIMIGGGVLAYTLLGVDYNDATGDCAFLILDPHYTGGEDVKKIVNSGWCGWKKAIDSKGKSFFLADKFYNLLMPQRPNMV
ncbi:hypothetical protein RND81_05G233300 [Saponaria officinalis]|uniref:Probable Ufm1-specific protease n=1 Tax=Saponaria officinalis TaxID=3572 RepID=A0AAW1L001_SAPOF